MVARAASSHNVVPGVLTPAGAGDYVVNGEIAPKFTTVLADIPIASEDLTAG